MGNQNSDHRLLLPCCVRRSMSSVISGVKIQDGVQINAHARTNTHPAIVALFMHLMHPINYDPVGTSIEVRLRVRWE